MPRFSEYENVTWRELLEKMVRICSACDTKFIEKNITKTVCPLCDQALTKSPLLEVPND
jgi:rubrerythrin